MNLKYFSNLPDPNISLAITLLLKSTCILNYTSVIYLHNIFNGWKLWHEFSRLVHFGYACVGWWKLAGQGDIQINLCLMSMQGDSKPWCANTRAKVNCMRACWYSPDFSESRSCMPISLLWNPPDCKRSIGNSGAFRFKFQDWQRQFSTLMSIILHTLNFCCNQTKRFISEVKKATTNVVRPLGVEKGEAIESQIYC